MLPHQAPLPAQPAAPPAAPFGYASPSGSPPSAGTPPHHLQHFGYPPPQPNAAPPLPHGRGYPVPPPHFPGASHAAYAPPPPSASQSSHYAPYPPGGMSPALTSLFNAYSPSRPESQQPSPVSTPYAPYAPYPPQQMPAPIPVPVAIAPPQQQRAASTSAANDYDGRVSPAPPPGLPLLSRSSSCSLSSSSHTLLTSELGSFPRVPDPSTSRLIAANKQLVCYSVANGHIRVIGVMSGKTALVKGHTGKVLDMELTTAEAAAGRGGAAGERVAALLASVSTGGECIVWSLEQTAEELSTSVRTSLRVGGRVRDGHYRRVLWAHSGSDSRSSSASSPARVAFVSSESVDMVQVAAQDTAEPAALTEANSQRLFSGPVTDAAFGNGDDGPQLAVSQPSGQVLVLQLKSGERFSITPHVGSAVHRVFFLSSGLSRPAASCPFLLSCSLYDDNSAYKLMHAASRTVLSSLLLKHPNRSITHVAVDPSGSFLLIAHTARDGSEHGIAAVHIRRGGEAAGKQQQDARFDFLSSFSTPSAVLSFAVSNDGSGSVQWDRETVDDVQLFGCCTKPIVRYHMHTAAIMRRVEQDELTDDKRSEPAARLQQDREDERDDTKAEQKEETEAAAGNVSLLLTPQAIRAASSTSPPASTSSSSSLATPSSSSSASTSPASSSMSITLTGATSSSTSPVVKVLQRPPAINSSVIPSAAGSPSSSPTSSHAAAASHMSASRPSPEIPETPVSSPYAGPMQPVLSALATQTPGVLSFSSLSTPSTSRSHSATASYLSPSSSPPSTPAAPPARGDHKEPHRLPSFGSSPSPTVLKRKEPGAVIEVTAEEEAAGKETRRDKQEANLLARLDKLFVRHFNKVSTLAALQAEKAQQVQREELDRERKDRTSVEKQRTEALLKAVSSSIQSLTEQVPPALSASVVAALTPQLQAAVQSAVATAASSSTPSSAAAVDLEALSASIVASLRAPLHDAFKQTFGSVLLPGFEASTREMFKQIETVYVRMSDSNELMLRERADELMEQRGREADSNIAGDMQEVSSTLNALLTTNSALVQQLTAMQQMQQQQTATIAELRAMLQAQAAHHHHGASSAASHHHAAAPPPPAADYKQELSALLASQQYEAAFTRALSLGKVPPVTWLCSQLEPVTLLHTSNAAHRLSPAVLLSLIQQLGFSLRDEAAVKLLWIRESVMVLDRHDAIISKHVPEVLRGALQRVEEQLAGAWKEPSNRPLFDQGRTVKHLLTAMLGGSGTSSPSAMRADS